MAVRVFIADDHPIFRRGVKSLLVKEGYAVVGEADDGTEAVRMVQELLPDVAVLDFSMPYLNGVEVAREVMQSVPRCKTLLLTVHREEQYVADAVRAGVHGYVLKSEAATELLKALQYVNRGEPYLSPTVAQTADKRTAARARTTAESLSPRELQVLRMIAEGHTTKEIAAQLTLAVKTAESYRAILMNKLGIHDTAGLVRYAIRRGMIEA